MGPAPFTTMGPAFYRANAGAERRFLHLKYLNEGIARRWAEHREHKAEQHSRIPTHGCTRSRGAVGQGQSRAAPGTA